MGLNGSNLKRAFAFAGIVATALTMILASVSGTLSRNYRERAALAVARQVASQGESLYIEAKNKGEKDPLGWVVVQLSRGEEPRVIRVSRIVRIDRSPASEEDREDSSFNDREGTLDFSRRFVFDAATGLRILVASPYVGFLGSQSRVAGDLLLFACWGVLFALGFGAFRAWEEEVLVSNAGSAFEDGGIEGSSEDEELGFPRTNLRSTPGSGLGAPPPVPSAIPSVGSGVALAPTGTVDTDKLADSLRETARSIKGLFEGTVKFARSLAEVNGHVAGLRKSIHRSISEASRDEKQLAEWIRSVRAAEVEGFNGVSTMARIREHFLAKGFDPESPEMKSFAQMSAHYERIARLANQGRVLSENMRERIVALELALEPLSADADLAAHACERASAASGEIDLATVAVQRRMVEHSHLIKPTAKVAG